MEEEYNWNLILKVAVPIALIGGYLFYNRSIIDGWRWFFLAVGIALAGLIVYSKSRKKQNIFTAAGLVFLVAVVVRLLTRLGIF